MFFLYMRIRQYEIISACTDRFSLLFSFFGLMTLQSVERWKWVGESIGDRVENKKERERERWHPCDFFKLLRRFSHSFSTLSRSLCLSWMAAWQQRRLFLASSLLPFSKNSLSCAGLLQPVWGPSPSISLPFFFFFSILSFFLCTHSHFLIFNISFCNLYLIPPTIFPIFQHLIILKFAFLISPFLTSESLSLSTQNKMKK